MSADLSFRMRIFIAAGPEDVWRALTEADLSARWWDPIRSADWRVGGRVVYEVSDGHTIGCEVLEMDPPRRLVMTFDCDAYPDHPPTRLTWEIEPVEGGCMLEMHHGGFQRPDLGLHDVCRLWPGMLAALIRLVEGLPEART